MAGFSKDFVF